MAGGAEVEGLKELDLALRSMNRDVDKELRAALLLLVQPVRNLAAQYALQNIANIGPKWSKMRVGYTSGVVYVAPAARRHGGSPRPNLAGLLEPVMQQAVDDKEPEIYAGLEVVMDELVTKYG